LENALGKFKEKGRPVRERRAVLRIGSVCAIVGTFAYASFGALHGPLSGSGGAEVIFRHVLERPYWAPIHLGSMLAILLWLGTFVALERSSGASGNDSRFSLLAGRLAVVSLTVGAAVSFLHFSIDGYVLAELADRWATAPPAEREEVVRMGEFVHTLLRQPLFVVELVFLFGLPFALIGLRIALDREYPTWLGWAGAVVGTATFVTGAMWFANLRVIPELVLFVALLPLEWLWLLALGVVMWLRSNVVVGETAAR
jgi:hypothetical protein